MTIVFLRPAQEVVLVAWKQVPEHGCHRGQVACVTGRVAGEWVGRPQCVDRRVEVGRSPDEVVLLGVPARNVRIEEGGVHQRVGARCTGRVLSSLYSWIFWSMSSSTISWTSTA